MASRLRSMGPTSAGAKRDTQPMATNDSTRSYWATWHDAYDDPESDLSQRLIAVQSIPDRRTLPASEASRSIFAWVTSGPEHRARRRSPRRRGYRPYAACSAVVRTAWSGCRALGVPQINLRQGRVGPISVREARARRVSASRLRVRHSGPFIPVLIPIGAAPSFGGRVDCSRRRAQRSR
jgi:hypothetical protein